MAVVVAKNTVGSSWRKTLSTREWSHIPEEEKHYVRTTAMSILLQDTSDRIALQAALLIANICRFDVPRPWSSLLPDLANAAAVDSPIYLGFKTRALTALKYVLRSLRTKRFVIESPNGRPSTTEELEVLGEAIDADRATMFRHAKDLLGVLRAQWHGNFTVLLQRGAEWELKGPLAVAGLAAIRELLLLIPDLADTEAEFHALLSEGAEAARAVAVPLFSGGSIAPAIAVDTGDVDVQAKLYSKCWERLLQIAQVAMDRHTVGFAQHIAAWVGLCVNTVLLGLMDSSTIHGIRAKSRMILTRFVARAMLQPLYQQDTSAEEAEALASLPFLVRQRMSTSLPALQDASAALDAMVKSTENGPCRALVEAIISKYIALSSDELAEWQADPEGFARQIDVDTSPDADTPRPCGVALLQALFKRNESGVGDALVGLASILQAQPLTQDNIIPREATYRAIGECFLYLRTRVDFNAWYSGELRSLLASEETPGIESAVLRARALWLVGVCGEELRPEAWADAYNLTVAHIRSADFVVALMAVSAALCLVGNTLEESSFVSQPPERQRLLLFEGGLNDGIFDGGGDVAEAAHAEFQAHFKAIENSLDSLITGCFGLLQRLEEPESMVRVLTCVSEAIELLGDEVKPHLGAITGSLPQIWGVVSAGTGDVGNGARVRLHCSLLAMLAHLLSKLGSAAMDEPQVAGVLLPLLQHATNIGSPETEPLLDDGLKLWMAMLQATRTLTPELIEMVGARLGPILHRGRDNTWAFKIAGAYVLHGGIDTVGSISGELATGIVASLTSAMEGMQPKSGTQPGSITLGTLAGEVAQEAVEAAVLLGSLQRAMQAQLLASLEAPLQATFALVGSDYGGGVLRLPSKSLGIVEACIEVIQHVVFVSPATAAALIGSFPSAQNRFIDRWIALSATRDVGELFIPTLAAVGRARRHRAGVAICAAIVSDAFPALHDVDRAAQALVLGLRAAREQRTFESDQRRLADAKPSDPNHADQVMLRRLMAARSDPLRTVDATDAVRAAAGHVTAWAGTERILAAIAAVDPMYREQLAALLAGQLPDAVEEAAIESMKQAALS